MSAFYSQRGGGLIRETKLHVPKVVIPEVCKIGKILYVHLYREKWYRKVA